MVSAGFVGLLGRSAQELAHTSEYPMGAFLAALGFMLTLAADQAADGCSAGHVRLHEPRPNHVFACCSLHGC